MIINQAQNKNFIINKSDIIIFSIATALILLTAYAWHEMHLSFIDSSSVAKISLDPSNLPYYMLRTTMRLVIGMIFSFIFALIAGYACAKNKHFARVCLPIINFLESAPLLGFLTFTTAFFLFLFPHSLMGLESAAIFGIFTSQAWNMALVLYQTIRIVPTELVDLADAFNLNAWQKFWKIELPYSTPGMLWNIMVSQSAAWFAITASEAIPVATNNINLPGVGSYIATALESSNIIAILYALLAIIINIILFDQIFFRPLIKWSEKFKYESIKTRSSSNPWLYRSYKKSRLVSLFTPLISSLKFWSINGASSIRSLLNISINFTVSHNLKKITCYIWYICITVLCLWVGNALWNFFPNGDMTYLIPLMFETTLRVAIAMVLSVLICTPLGIWIGLSANRTKKIQPIIQVCAAIPQPIFFPIVAILLLTSGGSLNIWTIPLIMTGTSWYVLFNVIAGVSSLPTEIVEMTKSFQLKGLKWWYKFAIPAVFPYIVCGIISAAGGAWNSAIAAEVVIWGSETIKVDGIGALVSTTTSNNQIHQAALAVVALCSLVALCVIFIWRPLYKLAETKYKCS
ncbi:ABC transporter permease subunit [Francisella adeliensis]|uniref:ABC transporter permease subunit n=1 Tax=Francisella adeliensis TaxID=2007306 RepID=A0A2Z4XZD5_9GAMM|nr:ABC transporter permease subunit [Francisella adeliensis]AXA34221.1 metal ABC transporter permease [Francisella adeliensis]MBK2084862.1 ABC transporter permease subunit [Francisella adeliensis]MBK2096307.1 ABC transporter permease subunit [Francisella adeliensis]QIW12465.1 ABC transporter permease subunit [Francisella adeliensis]QIW14338.1 ABC transporter permease subunit [Francisella adeliensis]